MYTGVHRGRRKVSNNCLWVFSKYNDNHDDDDDSNNDDGDYTSDGSKCL